METIDIIRAVIGLITLIVFFVMANNISQIKKQVTGNSSVEHFMATYKKAVAWNRDEEL